MSETKLRELDASIREIRLAIEQGNAEAKQQLAPSLQALLDARAMLVRAMPAMEETAKYRPQLDEALRRFFTPEPAAQVPAWLPDTLRLDHVRDDMMRAPEGTRIYRTERTVSVCIPRHGGWPVRHGLEVTFHYDGSLQHQTFHEQGLIRWGIRYHAAGGREQVGFYSSREEKEYREHGLHTHYAANGIVTGQHNYQDGLQHGWSKIWDDDGHPVSAVLFDHGKRVEEVYPNGERRRA
jgi:hypothetical protein